MEHDDNDDHFCAVKWWCPRLRSLARAAARQALVVLVFIAGCERQPADPQPIVAVTRVVGSWSGRGTRTVGDVPSETGRFRIVWQTSNESSAGAGTFKLTLRSAISGRTIGVVTDTTGIGSGTAEYDEGPRTYDFLVESANIDWRFHVEETLGEVKK